MAASGLPPHPLIIGLATRLVDKDELPGARDAARNKARLDESDVARRFADVTSSFAHDELPELAIFSGYLGGTIEHDENEWRLLYQDPKALTWLLVPDDQIVMYDRVEDKSAPFKQRDVIWLKNETPVRQGLGAESDQARFLVGPFTSAGDLHASLTGDSTLPAESGILCAPTPMCCTRHTR